MTPGRGAAKLARVALFSVTAVALGCMAHRFAGGTVSPVVALTAVAVVMLAMNPFAGRRHGFTPLFAAMSVLQAVLHYAFMTASQASDCHVAPIHHVSGGPGGMTMTCAPEMNHSVMALAHPASSTAMTATHALAVVLLVLILARGEAALWALADALGFRIRLMIWTPLIPAARVLRFGRQRAVRAPRMVIAKAVLRRGPPVLVRTSF